MPRLEEFTRGATVKGVLPECLATVVNVKWHGSSRIELTYKDPTGRFGSELLYRHLKGGDTSPSTAKGVLCREAGDYAVQGGRIRFQRLIAACIGNRCRAGRVLCRPPYKS